MEINDLDPEMTCQLPLDINDLPLPPGLILHRPAAECSTTVGSLSTPQMTHLSPRSCLPQGVPKPSAKSGILRSSNTEVGSPQRPGVAYATLPGTGVTNKVSVSVCQDPRPTSPPWTSSVRPPLTPLMLQNIVSALNLPALVNPSWQEWLHQTRALETQSNLQGKVALLLNPSNNRWHVIAAVPNGAQPLWIAVWMDNTQPARQFRDPPTSQWRTRFVSPAISPKPDDTGYLALGVAMSVAELSNHRWEFTLAHHNFSEACASMYQRLVTVRTGRAHTTAPPLCPPPLAPDVVTTRSPLKTSGHEPPLNMSSAPASAGFVPITVEPSVCNSPDLANTMTSVSWAGQLEPMPYGAASTLSPSLPSLSPDCLQGTTRTAIQVPDEEVRSANDFRAGYGALRFPGEPLNQPSLPSHKTVAGGGRSPTSPASTSSSWAGVVVAVDPELQIAPSLNVSTAPYPCGSPALRPHDHALSPPTSTHRNPPSPWVAKPLAKIAVSQAQRTVAPGLIAEPPFPDTQHVSPAPVANTVGLAVSLPSYPSIARTTRSRTVRLLESLSTSVPSVNAQQVPYAAVPSLVQQNVPHLRVCPCVSERELRLLHGRSGLPPA